MKFFIIIFVVFCVLEVHSHEDGIQSGSNGRCSGNDWYQYGTEKCFKLFKEPKTHILASRICIQQDPKATMAFINSSAERQFVTETLLGSSPRSVWIRRPNNECCSLRPDGAVVENDNCQLENWVLCERPQISSVVDDSQLSIVNSKLLELTRRLGEIESKIENLSSVATSTSIPVGFIYTQLQGQGDPYELWGYTMHWTDITSEYAGLFFRALGDESAAFNETQEANDHYLRQVMTVHAPHGTRNWSPVEPNDQYSGILVTGKIEFAKTTSFGLRFIVSGGEIRPRNQAVRIWKRIH